MKTPLQRLGEWYSNQCNGEWEHSWGFKITTVDNPGVAVVINLANTPLAGVPFPEFRDKYESLAEWMLCRRVGDQFEGLGTAVRLEDIILQFLAWSDRHPLPH